jgi:hypothetical protein
MTDELSREEVFEFQPDETVEEKPADSTAETATEVEAKKPATGRREWSDESKERLRQKMAERWQDLEYRRKVAEGRARAKQQKGLSTNTSEADNKEV